MADPFLGEIRQCSFQFAPRGWALCNGQVLSIAQNQALFSLLGTTYGGDGRTTFALPDLRSRVPLHFGTYAGFGQNYVLGQKAGTEAVTLISSQLPQHTHPLNASGNAGTAIGPTNGSLAATKEGAAAYAPTAGAQLASGSLANTGGSQPHSNLPPILVINFIIALQGIYPSRN